MKHETLILFSPFMTRGIAFFLLSSSSLLFLSFSDLILSETQSALLLRQLSVFVPAARAGLSIKNNKNNNQSKSVVLCSHFHVVTTDTRDSGHEFKCESIIT